MGGGILFGNHSHIDPRDAKEVKSMLKEGKDPKDYLIEVCKPQCIHWQDKLKRCEIFKQKMEEADPEKSCMYPFRDWVTCIDSCVIMKVMPNLVGHESGWFS